MIALFDVTHEAQMSKQSDQTTHAVITQEANSLAEALKPFLAARGKRRTKTDIVSTAVIEYTTEHLPESLRQEIQSPKPAKKK